MATLAANDHDEHDDAADTKEMRRQPPARELRLPRGAALTDATRAGLWEIVHGFLFAPEPGDRWAAAVSDRPVVQRVWSSPPLGGILDRIPEDVAEVLEGWFALVESGDVMAFLESVHDALEPAYQPRFAAGCNAVLERGLSDHRFVMRRLLPIASKADIAAIERAVAATARTPNVQGHLLSSIARLAQKPQPDRRGAIEEAVRAVELAAFALTGERHLSLDEALDALTAKGHLDIPLKTAYAGLFDFVSAAARPATIDEARLIVVMCSGFIAQLVAKAA
jgi:hypothetical protein